MTWRRVFWLGLLAAALLSWSCTGNSGSQSGAGDAGSLLDAALTTTKNAASYHVSYLLIPESDPADDRGSYHWDTYYQQPDTYRVLLFSPVGDSSQVCDEQQSPGHSSSDCHTVVTDITGETVFEAILIGDREYGRACQGIGISCEEWDNEEREPIPAFGLSTLYVPGWPLVAAEQATDLDLESPNTVRGKVRLERAIVDNMHSLAEQAHMPEDEFQDFAGISVDDPSLDAGPADDILITISPDGSHITKIELSNAMSNGTYLTVEYSEFNAITIAKPQ